jgi:hypothetical protein
VKKNKDDRWSNLKIWGISSILNHGNLKPPLSADRNELFILFLTEKWVRRKQIFGNPLVMKKENGQLLKIWNQVNATQTV